MPELFDTRYFRGQGPLFMGPRDAAGNPAGLIFVGDVGEATVTGNVERSEIRENVSGIGAIGSSFARQVRYELAISMRSIKRDHLARALQGAAVQKAGASITNEVHTAYRDKFTRLQHTKVSAVVVTNTAGTTTYVANTDYALNAAEGILEILPAAITEAQVLHIDYAYATQYHIQVAPANQELYLLFAGKNSANNDKQTRCEIYKALLNPSALSMITDEHAEMAISGQLLLDKLRVIGDQFYSWKIED